MSERALPPGWVSAKVGDILEVNYGKGLPKAKRDESGQVPVYGSNGVVGRHSSALTDNACIVIGRKGAAGAVHLSRIPCWPIDTTYYVTPPAELSLEYIYYALGFLDLASLDKSTAIPGLNRDDLYSQTLPLPPLPEQHRIVAEIEKQLTRLDAGLAALRRAGANVRRYKAAVLKAACEGRLVPQDAADEPASLLLERILAERRARWEAEQIAKGKDPKKLKYKEPAAPDREGLPELPEGWVWASLEQCFKVQRGRFSVRPRNDPRYYDGRYPFVQIGDLPRDGGNITEYSQTLNEKGLQVSRMFKRGTVLIAIVGATIANTGILTFDSCSPDSLVGIQADDDIRLCYVEIYLRSKKHEIRDSSYASGGQPNINLQTLNPYPVPLPPLAEQQRIVAEVERRLSVVEGLEASIEANLKRAERLRQAVLKRAFAGQLVPQDPSDEPADVLLERIRVERERRG